MTGGVLGADVVAAGGVGGEGVAVAVLVERLGRLSDDRMRELCGALAVAVDCE